MADFVEVGKTNELADGTMKRVWLQGKEILLAYIGGKYYASISRCPHMGALLTRGKLKGTILTCPLHGSQFDLKDGRVVRWVQGKGIISWTGRVMSAFGMAAKNAKPLSVYEVKIEGDRILAKIP